MQANAELAMVLRQLEERLLDAHVRKSAATVGALLAEDFVEFGGSGRVFDKTQIIAALQDEPVGRDSRSVTDFKATELAAEVVLLTYRIVRPATSTQSLRSSIWKQIEGRWQMVFHQGTLSGKPQ